MLLERVEKAKIKVVIILSNPHYIYLNWQDKWKGKIIKSRTKFKHTTTSSSSFTTIITTIMLSIIWDPISCQRYSIYTTSKLILFMFSNSHIFFTLYLAFSSILFFFWIQCNILYKHCRRFFQQIKSHTLRFNTSKT